MIIVYDKVLYYIRKNRYCLLNVSFLVNYWKFFGEIVIGGFLLVCRLDVSGV